MFKANNTFWVLSSMFLLVISPVTQSAPNVEPSNWIKCAYPPDSDFSVAPIYYFKRQTKTPFKRTNPASKLWGLVLTKNFIGQWSASEILPFDVLENGYLGRGFQLTIKGLSSSGQKTFEISQKLVYGDEPQKGAIIELMGYVKGGSSPFSISNIKTPIAQNCTYLPNEKSEYSNFAAFNYDIVYSSIFSENFELKTKLIELMNKN